MNQTVINKEYHTSSNKFRPGAKKQFEYITVIPMYQRNLFIYKEDKKIGRRKIKVKNPIKYIE